jgi:hypothetical protein
MVITAAATSTRRACDTRPTSASGKLRRLNCVRPGPGCRLFAIAKTRPLSLVPAAVKATADNDRWSVVGGIVYDAVSGMIVAVATYQVLGR